MDQLEQGAVGIAVHHALDRRMRLVADRVGQFLRERHELVRARDELARDRIGRIGRVDQRRHGGRHRHGIARRDRIERRALVGRHEPARGERLDAAQRLAAWRLMDRHGFPLPGSATGVQSTSSIRLAPVQSITRRSKPSAMPLACGICASAARKSASIG